MAGDSTAMTIDFLRARLLSERSVSRTARERADQLSKRVLELEEQLRIVINQRKNAEKATSEVLDILESQGFGFDLVDSSSDLEEDENQETEESISTSPKITINEECDNNSNLEEKEKDESPPAGSLSWKGRSKNSDLNNKNNKVKQLRQIQRRVFYFTSPVPSPKYQLGKSCRKIKPARSGAEDEEEKENSKFSSDSNNENISTHNNNNNINNNNDNNNNINEENYEERKEEMERALEEQANLIDKFQAEENAQREWEKMYNETRNPITQENIESENKDCPDENSCENNKEISDHASEKSEEIKLNLEILSSNESVTEKITDTSYEKAIIIVSNEKEASSVPNSPNEKQVCSVPNEFCSVPNSPSSESNNSLNYETNPLALQIYQPPIDKVSNVLEELKRAKISLLQNINKNKNKTEEILAITQHGEKYNNDINPIVNIPTGTTNGLFRLPNELFKDSVLNLEYSKDLMKRFSNKDYFETSNNNNRYGLGNYSNIGVPRFYEDLSRRILYGGDMDL